MEGGPLSRAFRPLTIGIIALVGSVAFEAMAVATAMPVVARELNGESAYGLAFSLFLTAALVATVAAGSWCDLKGPRPALLTGLALIVGGLLVSGLSGAFLLMTVGRAVSGLGGGLLVVALYVIIGEAYPGKLQPIVFGWMSAAWVLPSLIGPLVAGYLAQSVSWRWVFLGVVPITVCALALVWPRIRELGAPEPPSMDASQGRRRSTLGLLLGSGVFVLQWALHGTAEQASWWLAAAMAAGALAVAWAAPRLLPVGAFRLGHGLPSVVMTRGLLAMAFFGAEAFVPLMLVNAHGLQPAMAGLALTGGALGWSIGAFLQSRVRLERHWILVAAAAATGVSIAAMALLSASGTPFWLIMVVWALTGLSIGASFSTTSVLVLNLSTANERGRNSASLQLSDQLGSVAGTAGAGTLFAALRDPAHPEQIGVFVVIWVSLAAAALLGIVAAARSGPASGGPAGRVKEQTGVGSA
ncbi:MFS transporter [Arthrobacter sp. ISL-30]|uniref:MFS transporter n=1 Tax=Arthrobacter sp. ISL-30 TaxID=2819109 RepID=UPI001BE7B1E7|nr:MFS transporter [Arthrobacter sp. ISL-30]MBT2513981.1 MFS transporter [Arthrobacter sp. ISL-30]